jgi:hypothetical protein
VTKAFSPAPIGKAYLDAMAVRPRPKRRRGFARGTLGKAMGAYYGGRAECRIRRVGIPVVYFDFLSMYSNRGGDGGVFGDLAPFGDPRGWG